MGRPPKNAPKDAPLVLDQLTEKQADLLGWVYDKGEKNEWVSTITWSAKAYLDRSPSNSEAATLSKRVNTLVDYGLLKRQERVLELTETGTAELYRYAQKNSKSLRFRILALRLEVEKTAQEVRVLSTLNLLVRRHQLRKALTEDEVNRINRSNEPLIRVLQERMNELMTQLNLENERNDKRQLKLKRELQELEVERQQYMKW